MSKVNVNPTIDHGDNKCKTNCCIKVKMQTNYCDKGVVKWLIAGYCY